MTSKLDKIKFGPWSLVTGASSGIGREFAHRITKKPKLWSEWELLEPETLRWENVKGVTMNMHDEIATVLVPQKLSESFGPRTRIDLAGVGLVSLGALSLVWGLVRAADSGWSEAMTLGALVVGVSFLGAFLAWEARATDPMLPLRLFRSRPFLAANATRLRPRKSRDRFTKQPKIEDTLCE